MRNQTRRTSLLVISFWCIICSFRRMSARVWVKEKTDFAWGHISAAEGEKDTRVEEGWNELGILKLHLWPPGCYRAPPMRLSSPNQIPAVGTLFPTKYLRSRSTKNPPPLEGLRRGISKTDYSALLFDCRNDLYKLECYYSLSTPIINYVKPYNFFCNSTPPNPHF